MHTARRRMEVNKERQSIWKEVVVSEIEIKLTVIRLEGQSSTTKYVS
jgi:hypothetical protein